MGGIGKLVTEMMQKDLVRMDVVSHNLANVSSPGFRRVVQVDDGKTFRAALDSTAGHYKQTSAPLDFAMEGAAWFEVQTADGRSLLTRQGAFTSSSDGYLVTTEGHRVMGEGGPVRLDRQGRLEVAEDGSIYQDGRLAGRLRLVAPSPEAQMRGVGNGLYEAAGGSVVAAQGRVRASSLEQSNVNPLSEMTEFMALSRSFEMGQKALMVDGEVRKRLINDVGRST